MTRHGVLGVSLLCLLELGFVFASVPVGATHDPNDFWVTDAVIPGQSFTTITGSASHVWAASGVNIFKRTASWAIESSIAPEPIFDLWANSDTLAYATFNDGAEVDGVLKYTGTWANDATFPIDDAHRADAVFGRDANRILVARPLFRDSTTPVDTAIATDGSTWDTQQLVSSGQTNIGVDVWTAPSPGDAHWIAFQVQGAQTLMVRCDVNDNLNPCGLGDDTFLIADSITAIWGTSESNIWAVSELGNIWRWDNIAWTLSTSFAQNTGFNDIWGTSASDIWAVGNAGFIIHYDGTTWTPEPSPTGASIRGVWCRSVNVCWMVAGDTIFNYQVNPAIANPTLAGLQWDPADMIVRADDACLGDEVALSVNLEPSLGAGGLNWYVINSDSNVVVETGTGATFFSLNNKHFHTSRPYPSGEYTFLVTADVIGLLTPDNWAAEAFNVDTGTCYTAADHTHLHTHFGDLNDLINSIEFNFTERDEGLFGLANLPGFSQSDTTLFLLLFGLFIWTSLKGWWFVAFSSGISSLATAGAAVNDDFAFDLPVIAIIFLLFLGFWVEIAIHNYRRSKERAEVGPDGQPLPRPF